ncbi:NAD-dependent epimerase/dehydratase family protein [Algoriphagus aestuarii]|nr:NAD-dependent epimerase/dehydratase family protein [Algoriphagus aestuarii]
MKEVGIIGLGWTGKPLAKFLTSKGCRVVGSTTSEQKKIELLNSGLDAVRLEMNPHPEGNGFQKLFDCEYLVINIPPRSRIQSAEFYLEQIKFLKSMINHSKVKKVVFISSTGIYPSMPTERPYEESFDLNSENVGNKTLWEAEKMISNSKNYELTILRFSGLMGEQRIPGKYFAGKEHVIGHTRVNYIHQDDAVLAISWIIENEIWGELFNATAPIHPKRKEVYEQNAKVLGMGRPKSYAPEKDGEDRLVATEKLIKTGFRYSHPNPLDFPFSG